MGNSSDACQNTEKTESCGSKVSLQILYFALPTTDSRPKRQQHIYRVQVKCERNSKNGYFPCGFGISRKSSRIVDFQRNFLCFILHFYGVSRGWMYSTSCTVLSEATPPNSGKTSMKFIATRNSPNCVLLRNSHRSEEYFSFYTNMT